MQALIKKSDGTSVRVEKLTLEVESTAVPNSEYASAKFVEFGTP